MRKKILFGIFTIGLVVFLVSCGKEPVAEIESANGAIEKAAAAEAELYAPQEFAALNDSMKVALVLIEAQKSKTIKKYNAAKEKLQEVVSTADSVAASALANKEQMKVDIQTIMTEVKTLLEENNNLITQAPKGKEGTAALVEIKNEITAIETSMNEASGIFEKGDLIAALEKVKTAKDKATSINTELKEVIAKYTQKGTK